MIDRIVRKNYNEFWIVFTNRPVMKVTSSGNAWALIDWVLYDRDYLPKHGSEIGL